MIWKFWELMKQKFKLADNIVILAVNLREVKEKEINNNQGN